MDIGLDIVLGLGLGLGGQVLGLGLEGQVLGLGLGLEGQVLGLGGQVLGLGLEGCGLDSKSAGYYRSRFDYWQAWPIQKFLNRAITFEFESNLRRSLPGPDCRDVFHVME